MCEEVNVVIVHRMVAWCKLLVDVWYAHADGEGIRHVDKHSLLLSWLGLAHQIESSDRYVI